MSFFSLTNSFAKKEKILRSDLDSLSFTSIYGYRCVLGTMLGWEMLRLVKLFCPQGSHGVVKGPRNEKDTRARTTSGFMDGWRVYLDLGVGSRSLMSLHRKPRHGGRLRTEKQLCGMGIHVQMSLRQRSKTRVEMKSSLTVGILFYRGPTSYLEILGSIEEFLKIPFHSI